MTQTLSRPQTALCVVSFPSLFVVPSLMLPLASQSMRFIVAFLLPLIWLPICPSAVRAADNVASSEAPLGLAAPEGAVVLFDGSGFDAWKPFSFLKINPKNNQSEVQWQLVDGDAMQITVNSIPKREDFQFPIQEQLIVELCSK